MQYVLSAKPFYRLCFYSIMIGLATIFLTSSHLCAQDKPTLFDYTSPTQSLSEEILNRVNLLKLDPSYLDVKIITIRSLPKTQKDGFVSINLPDVISNIEFEARDVTTNASGDFSWYGVTTGSKEGWMLLMRENGDTFGHIVYGKRDFKVLSSNNQSVIIESNLGMSKEVKCKFKPSKKPKSNGKVDKEKITSKSQCNDRKVRVLVIYTPAVKRKIYPPQEASLLINTTNIALQQSGVSSGVLRFELAGVRELPGFVEDPNNRAITDAQIIRNMVRDEPNGFLATLQRTTQADLIYMLGDGDYTEIGAAISGGDFFEGFAYAVSDIDASPSRFTPSHELGHLLLCRHDDDIVSNPAYPQSKGHRFLVSGGTEKWTIMATDPANNGRIKHFSNPNISFDGASTGIIDQRDNARHIIQDASRYVPCYQPYTEPTNVVITGYNRLPAGESSSWCADVYGCTNIASYNWQYSTDGFNYTNIFGSNCITRTAPSNSNQFFLRVIVTCANGETGTDTHRIEVEASGGGGPIPIMMPNEKSLKDIEVLLEFADSNSEGEGLVVFPNPANDNIKVKLENSPSKFELRMYDIGGRIIYNDLVNNLKDSKVYTSTIETSNLNPGMYIISVYFGEYKKSISRKIFIE